MVRVLKEPDLKIECWKCKAELGYSPSEAEYHRINQDYLGDFDTVRGIICPCCRAVVEVPF